MRQTAQYGGGAVDAGAAIEMGGMRLARSSSDVRRLSAGDSTGATSELASIPEGGDAESTKTGASDDMSIEMLALTDREAVEVGVPEVLRLRGIAFASSDASAGTAPPFEFISEGDAQ
jgi:hypothetical protein